MKLRRVTSIFEALVLRDIRNECRQNMTHDQHKIGFFEQIVWYFSKYEAKMQRGALEAYLACEFNVPIGYALVRRDSEGKSWISGGIAEQFRGKGFGKELFQLLITQYKDRELWLDVFQDNLPALTIYQQLGFKRQTRLSFLGKDNRKVLVMRRRL